MSLTDIDVRRFIKRLQDLSTIPSILFKVISVVKDENASPNELYGLIAKDQSLAEKVVRVANSPVFGHSGEIKDIRQAIMFLGYNRIKSIAMGMSVMEMFPARNFNIKNLWIHSYEVAFLSAAISEIVPSTSPSESFLAGLLHDIGRIIFYKIDHNKFFEIKTNDDMLQREMELFGCTHADAGSWFAEETGLPYEIVYSMRYHHEPAKANDFKSIVSIVSLAEALSRTFSPRIEDDGIWTTEHDSILLELSLRNEDIESIGKRLKESRSDIEDFFK